MKVVVLEHFTSSPAFRGGAAIRAEGRAMRDAIVADLVALPGVGVTVLRSEARPTSTPDRLEIVRVPRQGRTARSRDRLFRAALRSADGALVIAPESGGVLERLVRIVEEERRTLLGPAGAFVRISADKLETFRRLRSAGVTTPDTEAIPFADAAFRLAPRPRPFVLKPRDGCGGQGAILVRRGDRLEAAIARVRRATRCQDFLMQPFIAGLPASVAFVSGEDRLLPLALCRQRLGPERRLAYLGGDAPWRTAGATAAIELARRAIESVDPDGRCARGYLGVDLVLGPSGPVVIEVNPRLTSSYLGLRRVSRINPAGLILAAATGEALPPRVTMTGVCGFLADGTVETVRRKRRAGPARRSGRRGWSFSAGISAASI